MLGPVTPDFRRILDEFLAAMRDHNNPCELDTREKVVQRKIRNCHRSPAGAKASDIFLGLMGTCRKNKISFWDYRKDRIYKTRSIPELKEIILAD